MIEITSSYSDVLYASASSEFPWLKDPIDPSRNMQLFVDGYTELTFTADRGDAAFDAIGRKNPVVVVDTVKGDVMTVTAHGFAEHEETFEVLWESCRTLLFQLPDGRQWYVQMRKRTKRLPPGKGDFFYIDIDMVEVDEP